MGSMATAEQREAWQIVLDTYGLPVNPTPLAMANAIENAGRPRVKPSGYLSSPTEQEQLEAMALLAKLVEVPGEEPFARGTAHERGLSGRAAELYDAIEQPVYHIVQ